MEYKLYDKLYLPFPGQNLTGKGRIIAVIDQPLWQKHPAYQHCLKNYYPVVDYDGPPNHSMHGAANLSIIAGIDGNFGHELQGPGISPDVKVDFIEHHTTKIGLLEKESREYLLFNLARCLGIVIEKIKNGKTYDVITQYANWDCTEDPKINQHAKKCDYLVKKIEEEYGIPVFSPRTLFSPLVPDRRVRRLSPQGFSQKMRYESTTLEPNQFAIPMEERWIAWPREIDCKEKRGLYYRDMKFGGSCWVTSHLAGMFANARQADPNITKDAFLDLLSATAKPVDFGNGNIIPVADHKAMEQALLPAQPAITAQNRKNPVLAG